MFPRAARLKRADFPAALSRGKRVSTPHFTAIVPEKARGYAVVVSKKTARLSVTRHRVKRRVLSALRSLAPLPGGMVIMPRPSVAMLDYRHVREELAALLSKIG